MHISLSIFGISWRSGTITGRENPYTGTKHERHQERNASLDARDVSVDRKHLTYLCTTILGYAASPSNQGFDWVNYVSRYLSRALNPLQHSQMWLFSVDWAKYGIPKMSLSRVIGAQSVVNQNLIYPFTQKQSEIRPRDPPWPPPIMSIPNLLSLIGALYDDQKVGNEQTLLYQLSPIMRMLKCV